MIKKIDGRQLRKKRKERGYTAYRLAKKLGVDVDDVMAWERNEAQPSKATVRRIVKLLNIVDLELRRRPTQGRGKGQNVKFYGR